MKIIIILYLFFSKNKSAIKIWLRIAKKLWVNILFEKQFISQFEENNKNNLTLKKTKSLNLHKKNKKVKKPKFIKRKKGRVSHIKTKSTSNYRNI